MSDDSLIVVHPRAGTVKCVKTNLLRHTSNFLNRNQGWLLEISCLFSTDFSEVFSGLFCSKFIFHFLPLEPRAYVKWNLLERATDSQPPVQLRKRALCVNPMTVWMFPHLQISYCHARAVISSVNEVSVCNHRCLVVSKFPKQPQFSIGQDGTFGYGSNYGLPRLGNSSWTTLEVNNQCPSVRCFRQGYHRCS